MRNKIRSLTLPAGLVVDYPLGYWLAVGAVVLHKLMLVVFTAVYNRRM